MVDDDWFEELNKYKWHKSSDGYAARSIRINGKTYKILMHRVVNNTPEGYDTDHINRNKLDNRACNLRTATRSENQMNRGLQSNNKSGYTGVCWHKCNKKYEVYYKSKHITTTFTLEDAVKAREEYIKRIKTR